MSEKIYALLLKLYPEHFRRGYGDEAMRLVHDRAGSEKGFLPGVRLWLDLLVDFAISLPREYSKRPTTPIVATQPLNMEDSFQLLAERRLNPTLSCLGGTLTAVWFWVCVSAVAHSGGFPVLLRIPPSLQEHAQSSLADLAAGGSPVAVGAYSFCITADRDIPSDSVKPLLGFDFASPGASGVALIDGKIVKRFENERRLSIRAHVLAGDHLFVLQLDRHPEARLITLNDDVRYCQPQ